LRRSRVRTEVRFSKPGVEAEEILRSKKIARFACLAVVLAAGLALADTPQGKALRDQGGDPANYTTDRVDRNGGDSCVDAPTITVSPYADSGNTTGYTDNWGPNVGGYGQDGEDQAYLIVLAAPDTVTVTVTPTDTGFDLATYMIGNSDCPNYSPVVLAGVDSGYGGDAETFTYAAAAGSYVIVVDSFLPGEVGPFTIEVLSSVPVELSTLTTD
jgi:hypothetical protein